jgi:hypothetical protein
MLDSRQRAGTLPGISASLLAFILDREVNSAMEIKILVEEL